MIMHGIAFKHLLEVMIYGKPKHERRVYRYGRLA